MNKKKQALNDKLWRSINQENPDTDNYPIPDALSKKTKSLLSIKYDLEDAHAALTELSVMHLMRNGTETIMIALWKAAIVTYGKCFTNSDDGGSKLELRDSFKDHEYFIPIHNSLMSVRNGFIAHRGDNEFEGTVMFLKVNRNDPQDITYSLKSLRAGTSSFPSLVDYLNVIEHLLHHIELKIQKQIQKIHEHLHNSDTK